MSAYFNQTNISPGTTQFITRSEVQAAFSTIASDLSGFDWNKLLSNPNPNFSTITMPTNGSISNPNFIQANGGTGVSTTITTYNRMFANLSDPYTLGIRDNAFGGCNYTPLALGQLWVKPQIFANQPTTIIAPQLMAYATSLSDPTQQKTVIQLNSLANGVALTNISSINGNPPSGATTFTNLTGSNLTTTGALTSPQIVSVSSINGVPYSAAYSALWTGSGSVTLTSGVAGVLATINLPAATLQPNQTYIYDVPINFVSFPGGQPTGMVCNVGIRLGNNGQINYQVPLYITSTSQGLSLNLTGIAQTNSTVVGSQQIQLIGIQNSGQNFTATWAAPVGGGANTYTIKPLS